MKHIHRTCGWASWNLKTPTGKPQKRSYGRCLYPLRDPLAEQQAIINVLPNCYLVELDKRPILPHDQRECPTWKPKGIP